MAYVVTDGQNYSDIADAIRSKGISGTFKPDEMASAVGQISTGEEVFYTTRNVGYTRHTVSTGTGIALANGQFEGAVYMESIEMPNWIFTPGGGFCATFYNCTNLKRIFLPKVQGLGREMFLGCTALEQVQIGSIGYPVTTTTSLGAFSNNHAVITIYVDAASIAEIPYDVAHYAPWGAKNATIIYRSSTTGEVIEA